MNNEPQIQEQKQVNQLLKRWKHFQGVFGIVWLIVLPLFMLLVTVIGHGKHSVGAVLWCTWILSGPFLYDGIVRKRFIAKMLVIEGRLLQNTQNYAHLSSIDRNSLLEMKAGYQKINPAMEMLRASFPPDDDATLLRAAMHSDKLVPNELLRATNTYQS